MTRIVEGAPGAIASPVSTAEYDAFGPWVLEVRTPEDVPRLYRGYPFDPGSSLLVLKIPRSIARRDANPDMDLYDHLLVVGPEHLTVLSRRSSAFIAVEIAYSSIVAIEDSVDLLDGRLILHTDTGAAMTLPYNGSSQRLMGRLVNLLRELSLVAAEPSGRGRSRWLEALPGGPASAPGLRDLGDRDVALVTEQQDLFRREPGLLLLAAHGGRTVAPRGSSLADRVRAARPTNLQGAVVCAAEHELQILCRRHWFVRRSRPVHSLTRLVIPVARIDAVTVRADARYAQVNAVTIRAGGAELGLALPAGSLMERVLAAVAA